MRLNIIESGQANLERIKYNVESTSDAAVAAAEIMANIDTLDEQTQNTILYCINKINEHMEVSRQYLEQARKIAKGE